MAKMKRTTFSGHKVRATVISVNGSCSWGHEANDTFSINCQETAGLCGLFYHDIFPYITMFQFGGGLPNEWGGPDVVNVACMDRTNLVKLELRRDK
ncbi:TIGR04076 family protein [Chloroflexota bacterium]